jgi:hypothetical protein
MTPHRRLNLALAAAIAVILSTSYLLDGPSEIDAARATAASVLDAQAAARSADRTESRTAQTNPD